MPKVEKNVGVRITCQSRDKQGMVYDLKCDAIKITISLAASSELQTEWNIEATPQHLPNPPVARAVGPSRGAALSALAEVWGAKGEAGGFPPLDWNTIRDVLATLRAL